MSSDQSPAIFDARGQIKRPSSPQPWEMLRTWLFCTCGGLFAALYSNAVRRYPLLRSECDVYHYLSVYMSQFIGHISVHLSLRNVLSVKYLQTVFCVGNRID